MPLELYVLYVVTNSVSGMGQRTYVDSDEAALQAYGRELVRLKPAEAATVVFWVFPAEGIPAAKIGPVIAA